MSKVSAQLESIVKCIHEYDDVCVKYVDEVSAQIEGHLISCKTPKADAKQYNPYIKVCRINTDRLFELAELGDPYGTKIIMEMAHQHTFVPTENDPVLYATFALLHEMGHFHDYIKDSEQYNKHFINATKTEISFEEAKKYRERPLELVADNYALTHIDRTIKEINISLFHGLLLSDTIVYG